MSDPRLSKYTSIRHFRQRNFHKMRIIYDILENFLSQMSYFSPFFLPKDHIQENFRHCNENKMAKCFSSEV